MSAIAISCSRTEPVAFPRFSFRSSAQAQGMTDKKGLIDGFAAALRFPHYYRTNWDSFDECIHDLDWLEPGPVLLRVINSIHLLSLSGAELKTLRRILNRKEAEYDLGFLWIDLDDEAAFFALRE